MLRAAGFWVMRPRSASQALMPTQRGHGTLRFDPGANLRSGVEAAMLRETGWPVHGPGTTFPGAPAWRREPSVEGVFPDAGLRFLRGGVAAERSWPPNPEAGKGLPSGQFTKRWPTPPLPRRLASAGSGPRLAWSRVRAPRQQQFYRSSAATTCLTR
jgi:hypothetical protein